MFMNCVSVHTVSLGRHYAAGTPVQIARVSQVGKFVMDLASSGKLKSMVCERIALEQVPATLYRLKERTVPAGKIVVTMPQVSL
jgi:hypothetical protein